MINQPEHIDLYGGSLSLTRFNRSSSTTLGVSYARGSGEAQVKANNPKIQDVVMNNLAVFLSASYSF
jgi:long-chain fatty acid transport protein